MKDIVKCIESLRVQLDRHRTTDSGGSLRLGDSEAAPGHHAGREAGQAPTTWTAS